MDFLDPAKQRKHSLLLIIGYCLVGLAICISLFIFLYYLNGYGLGKNGQVVQNGLMFVSSAPNPAQVYINGELYKNTTNTRAVLEEGQYSMELKRAGYRDWKRDITIDGGKVVHYDYPFLIPTKLNTTTQKVLDQPPTLMLQSPDKRWLMVGRTALTEFEVFDIKDPKKVQSEFISIPESLLTTSIKPGSLQLVEWSNDNKHVLVKHVFDDTYEYILIDRSAPAASLNLTKALGVNPTDIDLLDKKFDQYLLYDSSKQILSKASLSQPTPETYVDHVLAYKSYGTDMLLYAASAGPDSDGNVKIKLLDGQKFYTIRTLPHGSNYLVDLTKYDGTFYVAAGSVDEGKVFVYKNPIGNISNPKIGEAVPERLLKVASPSYMAFSSNARFLIVQGGTSFAVHDAEDQKGASYTLSDPLDAPQTNATWLDGHHLVYVSNGNVIIFDYDGTNKQVLAPASAAFMPSFSSNSAYLFTLVTNQSNSAEWSLSKTPLRIPTDL
jgi:hypothetical protein